MTASRNPEQYHHRAVQHGLPTAAVVRRKRRPPPWTSLLHHTNNAETLRHHDTMNLLTRVLP